MASANPPRRWTVEAGPGWLDLVETGVGKAHAAAAIARSFDPARHAGVLVLGIGGALPGDAPPQIGVAVLATASVFADEGSVTPDGFTGIDALGFPAGDFGNAGAPCCGAWAPRLGPACDRRGVVATVSTCSGTDAAATAIAGRTGAIAEAMEGAAAAAALWGLWAAEGLPGEPRFAEIRVISNTTGDRDRQTWDLPGSLRRLGEVARSIAAAAGTDGAGGAGGAGGVGGAWSG